jgi:hypothetical protein
MTRRSNPLQEELAESVRIAERWIGAPAVKRRVGFTEADRQQPLFQEAVFKLESRFQPRIPPLFV